jgi:prefoldin subunit 5
LRKKTYVFDGDTIRILEEIKLELGKKETQILKEALRLYYEQHRSFKKEMARLDSLVRELQRLTERVSDLSDKLDRCEERLRSLEEEVRKLGNR